MPYDNRHTLVPDLAASGAGDEVIMSAPFTFPEHAGEFVPLPPQENRAVQWSVFTLEHPTKPMNEEAAAAGFYQPLYGRQLPKIQILTIEDLLGGKRIELPHYSPAESFKKAPAQKKGAVPEQGSLL
jgi:hypothetical protein